MASIHVEKVVENLEYEFKTSLKSALGTVAPNANIDFNQLFKEFKKQVVKTCKQWERVDNAAVDTD